MNNQRTDGGTSVAIASEPVGADTNRFEGLVIINTGCILTTLVCDIASRRRPISFVSRKRDGQTNFGGTLKSITNKARIALANIFSIRVGAILRRQDTIGIRVTDVDFITRHFKLKEGRNNMN